MDKLYIAETRKHYARYCSENNLPCNMLMTDCITPNTIHILKGMDLSNKEVVIIDDPLMPYSFWIDLQLARTR